MANREEYRRIWLKCDDCGSEFPGEVTYTILKVSEETGGERPELNHILTRCPRDPSHTNIRPQDA